MNHPTAMMHTSININMAHMLRVIIESLPADDALISAYPVELSDEEDSSSTVSDVDPGVIVFSYNTLPSILINLIVSSPSSDTYACPNDWSPTISGARLAQRSYPNVNGPCSTSSIER